MNWTRKLVAVAGVALMAVGLASAQPGKKPEGAPAMRPPVPPPTDYAAIAEKVVSTSANVKEGDIVSIGGGPQDMPLLEELVVAVRKRGAHPLLLVSSESIEKKLLASTPEKYDTQEPKGWLSLAKLVNVHIEIPAVRDPNIYTAIPAERRAKMDKARQVVPDTFLKRKVRTVSLGNGFEPSPARARELGISEGELAKMFWDGLSGDYTTVQTKCDALKTTLAAGKLLKITHANGTDLTIKLKSKKVVTSDGVITDADVKAGGPGVQVWLPAGEAYLIPGAADGKLVDDRTITEGKVVEGLTLDLKAGKVTALTAKTGWDAVKARYDLAGAGKNELSMVDFGCNPAVKSSGKFESYVAAGTVTLGLGGNTWAGGTNKEPYSLSLHLPGTNVTLDGKPLIENGVLK
jgi:aminopeptidase